jgi:ketosteroid isomerase-like protein
MSPRDHIVTMLQAVNAGSDGERLASLVGSYDADCTLVDHARPQSPVRGREAVQAYWEEILTALPGARLEWEEPVGEGPTMMAQLRLTGRHVGGAMRGRPPAGNPIELELCSVWRLGSDGDVVEQHLYYDARSLDGQIARGVA